MIKLNLRKEPYWIDLPENVRVLVKPVTSAIMNASQSEVIKFHREKELSEGELQSDLVKALARSSIIKWENVTTSENKSAEVNKDNINELMDIWYIAQDFWNKYATNIFELEAEGKSSELCVNGTSQEETDTAKVAKHKGSIAKQSVPT